jgi:hypothetical protein
MRFLRIWLLGRAWVPAVAGVTLLAMVPRVVAKVNDGWIVSRAAGVYNWEQGPANESWPGETRFRWTKGQAALREPVRGAVLIVPIYLARPDLATQQVSMRVTVGGVPTARVALLKNGWQMLTYDLVRLLGEARWRSQRTVTLKFVVSPTFVPARVGPSGDTRELGVGLGVVRWSGPRPASSVGEAGPRMTCTKLSDGCGAYSAEETPLDRVHDTASAGNASLRTAVSLRTRWERTKTANTAGAATCSNLTRRPASDR